MISTQTHKTDHTILSVAIDHMCANNVNSFFNESDNSFATSQGGSKQATSVI